MDSTILTAGTAACAVIGTGIAVLYRRHIPFFACRRHQKLLKRYRRKGAHAMGSQIGQKQIGKGATSLSTEYSFRWEGHTYRQAVRTPAGQPVPSERMFFFEPSCPAAAICQDVPDLRGFGGYGIFLGFLGFFLSFLAFLGFQHQFDQAFAQVTPLLEKVASQPRIGAFSLTLLLLFVGNMELISYHFERLERRRKKAIQLGHVIKGTLEDQFLHYSPLVRSRGGRLQREEDRCTGLYRYEVNGETRHRKVIFKDRYAPHFLSFYYIQDPDHLFYEGEPEVLMPLRILLQAVLSWFLLYLVLLV